MARQGFALFRPAIQFGLNPRADVHHLAGAWSDPITSFFDVGANDGGTTVTALHQFPKAQVYSFEPHPDTFSALVTRIGGEPRVTCVNSALGSDVGEVEMFEYEGSQ
ncbi:MAG: FkbM family methyltransferase [Gammaproteobacteria bacterium]|nr:FkbM family methyltransferase [Gammaproteobacteria bacterium]